MKVLSRLAGELSVRLLNECMMRRDVWGVLRGCDVRLRWKVFDCCVTRTGAKLTRACVTRTVNGTGHVLQESSDKTGSAYSSASSALQDASLPSPAKRV